MKRRSIKFTGQVQSFFRSDCILCAQRFNCMTSGGVGKDKKQYLKQIAKIREPVTEAMQRGKELHEMHLSQYPEVNNLGIFNVINDLWNGKRLVLSEVPVCSKVYGLRGIIDKLEMQLKGNTLEVEITELKTGYYKGYLFQLAAYCMIFSDPNFEFVHEKKTPKGTYILGTRPLPNKPINMNIKSVLYVISAKRAYNREWMINNTLTKWGNGMTMAVGNRMKNYRKLHKSTMVKIEEIDSKVKDRQMFFGRKKLLKKSKPKVYKVIKC